MKVSIDNFDEVKLHLRRELNVVTDKIQKSISESKKENDKYKQTILKELLKLIQSEIVEKIDFSPQVNYTPPQITIPKIELPDIYVPETVVNIPPQPSPIVNVEAPNVNVSPADVYIDIEKIISALEPLQLLSNKPSSPISVRVSDGKKFLDAINQISKANDKMVQVFSSAQPGLTSDEYKELQRSSASVSSVGDSATSVTLLSANNNRKGFVIFNDSTAILYVKLGSAASTSSFTFRLTPYGSVSESNFRYTGIIDGIWASDAGGSARVTELT